jgi:hypothetical protein
VHLTEARLAAGEPAAFVGALRLKHVTDVMRQRIGSDYRLFFRLHPDHLQVIEPHQPERFCPPPQDAGLIPLAKPSLDE